MGISRPPVGALLFSVAVCIVTEALKKCGELVRGRAECLQAALHYFANYGRLVRLQNSDRTFKDEGLGTFLITLDEREPFELVQEGIESNYIAFEFAKLSLVRVRILPSREVCQA